MLIRRPGPTGTPRRYGVALAALVVLAAAAVGLAVAFSPTTENDHASVTASPSATASTPSPPPPTADRLPRTQQAGLTAEDGVVPDGATVFDARYPAVARLDASLLAALRAAAGDARRDGVTFYVESGWRSPAYQERLLRRAIAKYGSAAEAARWVATPETSAHVSGAAVDIGHAAAIAWLAEHGAAYGLCRIYRNEPWHYELRRLAAERGCPRMYADAAHDPRMQS